MKLQTIYKKTKKSNIIKIVRKKVSRDDIPCGIVECRTCPSSNNSTIAFNNSILILDANMIMEQIDAIENISVFDNTIIFLSEYNYLQEKNQNVFNKFCRVYETRNLYIFPNEFHKDCQIINEDKMNKSQIKQSFFIKSIEYYSSHLSYFQNKDYTLYVLTTISNLKSCQLNKNISNTILLSTNEFAKIKLKENPDLYNYIAFFEEAKGNKDDVIMYDQYTDHLSEEQMKTAIKTGKYFRGKIYFSPDKLDKAIVRVSIFDKEIHIINREYLNRTLHGDIVCVEILEESNWIEKRAENLLRQEDILEIEEVKEIREDNLEERININLIEKIRVCKKYPVGCIRGILRRNRLMICGTIFNSRDNDKCSIEENLGKIKNFLIFIPIDPKFPNFLVKLFNPEFYYNKRILVKFNEWSMKNPLPSAHFIKNIGEILDVKVENEVILLEHNVDSNPFPTRIINSLPKLETLLNIPQEEISKRLDIRKYTVASIDPPGCKDIDDALHCRVLENGNFEIGVHIADVTYYVKANSEIDKIAAKSSNTIYLVHKRTDMLPKVLTENFCSLVSNQDRLAFSVLWEINKDTLEVIDVKYSKTVIRSKASLTYQKAHEIMHDKNDKSELAISIRNLNTIARHIRKKRMDNGALILASNEMKFTVDFQTNNINDITIYQTYDTNELVEEYMLLANVYVAEKIYNHYPSCAVLRRHPSPKEKELNSLSNLLKDHGYDLNTTNSKILGESLDKIIKKQDSFFNKIIRISLTRTMNQAKYFSSSECDYSEFFHYGLAMPIYTHFTSPIRRYADVLVHRLLAAAIDVSSLPLDISNLAKVSKICLNMNLQNRVAFFCSKDSNDLSTYLFFSQKLERQIDEVVIFAISSQNIRGISIKYGIEAEIVFPNIKNINEEKKIITLLNGVNICIFDHVKVEIASGLFNYRKFIRYSFIEKL